MTIWIIAIAALELVWVVATANRLLALRQQVREAWSGTLVQLQRRNDLISHLQPLVQSTADHDRVQVELAAMRAELEAGASVGATSAAAQRLSGVVGRAIGVERLPALRSQANFADLLHQLVDVEDDLQGARMLFNQAVQRRNDLCRTLPAMVVARALGQRPSAYFEAPDLRSASGDPAASAEGLARPGGAR